MRTFARRLSKLFTSLLQAIFVVTLLSFAAFAAGEIDTTFRSVIGNVSGGFVYRTIVQSDGKILIGGNFQLINGTPASGIARLNPDGTLDSTFNPPTLRQDVGTLPSVYTMGLQSDGKILIGGQFYVNDSLGGRRSFLVRLNQDGRLDTSFATVGISNYPTDLTVFPDNKIAIGGFFNYGFQGTIKANLAGLNADGTIDTTRNFNILNSSSNVVNAVAAQSDGKLVIGGDSNKIERFNIDGSLDNTFPVYQLDASAFDLKIQLDGKIIVTGLFGTVNGFTLRNIFRINPNGAIDSTFNSPPAGVNIRWSAIAGNGKIAVGGSLTSYNGVSHRGVAVLNNDGTLDTNFGSSPANTSTVFDIAFQADGKLLVVGDSANNQNPLVRLNADGSVDSAFHVQIGNAATVNKVLVQPDGKILVGGLFNTANTSERRSLARFNADGSLDSGFSAGSFNVNDEVYSLDIQLDQKIIVGGNFDARRLNADGSLDVTFANSFGSRSVKITASGKILAGGANFLRQYDSNGTLDTNFNVQVNGGLRKIQVQSDGKILIGGDFTTVNSITRNRIARLNFDGTLDNTFNPTGANNTVYDIDQQLDGKVIISGAFTAVNFDSNRKYLARLNTDGSLDTTFTPVIDSTVYDLRIQPDGKLLIGGAFSSVNGVLTRLAKLNPDGSNDNLFNTGMGTNTPVLTIDQQTDGKIIIGGGFIEFNDRPAVGIARLLNSTALRSVLFDFDGDGKADLSVFRPSTNVWYNLRSSNNLADVKQFGLAGDVSCPADFDGDGKTDIAIFRPSTGDWWFASSITGVFNTVHFGQNGDIPRPSDFDGDGKADYVVFRPSENVWYRAGSTGQISILQFGLAGDIPLVGDFNGDGKSDLAIYRPSTGDWWYRNSATGVFTTLHWGISTDKPVPADYDGDGKTDFAVYRPAEGNWYVLYSGSSSYAIVKFGQAGDKPAAADYDGDGRADIAIYRPSEGNWYILKTTGGYAVLHFGIAEDVPSENAFVP